MSTPWWLKPCKPVDRDQQTAAGERQQQLTKPAGSLGQLEALAVQLAGPVGVIFEEEILDRMGRLAA